MFPMRQCNTGANRRERIEFAHRTTFRAIAPALAGPREKLAGPALIVVLAAAWTYPDGRAQKCFRSSDLVRLRSVCIPSINSAVVPFAGNEIKKEASSIVTMLQCSRSPQEASSDRSSERRLPGGRDPYMLSASLLRSATFI